jgi:hypothetical protein
VLWRYKSEHNLLYYYVYRAATARPPLTIACEQMSRAELLVLVRRHEQRTSRVPQGWFQAHQSAVILNKDGPGNDANISRVTKSPQQDQSPVVIPQHSLFDARSAPPLASSQGSHLDKREVRAASSSAD